MSHAITLRSAAEQADPIPRGTRVTAGPTLDQLRQRAPRELLQGFRPRAGAVAQSMIATVAREVPEYHQPLAGPLGTILATATQTVLLRSIDSIVDPRASRDDWATLYRSIGSAEFSGGRSLEAMRSACAVAEKALTQQVTAYVRRCGASVDLARMCTGAIVAHFRDVVEHATRGYTAAQAKAPRTLDRGRADLARLLVAERPTEPAVLAGAARAAGWDLPGELTVLALRAVAGASAAPLGQIGADVLVTAGDGEPYAIVPAGVDPSAVAERIPGWRVAVGPVARVPDAAASLRVARRALDLADQGLLPYQGLLDCADHSTSLMMFADDWLIDRLVERRLAPLAGLTERQQQRMLQTLNEWLATRGHANAIAASLGVHPQTVRYRVKKLEDLFGDQLADPDIRFELALAARAKLIREPIADQVTAEAC